MRGADEAGGYAAELVCCDLRARPDRTRTLTGDIAERASERSQTLPAGVECNLGDGAIGFTQQRCRPLDAPSEQVAMRRYTKGLLERAREMRRRDSAHARQAPHWPRFV